MHLLLIEDDAALHTALQRSLVRSGMRVEVCSDGLRALGAWKAQAPDVVVLDLSLPAMDGLDVLRQARQAGLDTPVLILTARGTVGDKVLGLNAGADDYLPKPFDLDELEARVRALHRRHGAAAPADAGGNSVQWGQLRHDRDNGAIYHQHKVLDLTPRELTLLSVLMAKQGQALSKERLFELVFPGETHVQYEAIEVVVYRLRKKLANTGVVLTTLRGLGYLLKLGN
ncbi:MAG: two-component system response regulator [Burkholderiales bacterium RIFCSPLOWO2_12_FULL_61_40]|nr:MAG: two-component system response regulator [Burkholderiales bacterium RIFCSPLOWO2_12_FULL_61_40]